MRDRFDRKRSVVDVILVLSALAFAAPAVAYPLGRDQALFHYVGREWALHGAVPYRDTFEQKTPWIHFVHAVAVLLAGDVAWLPRAFDVVACAATGACAAWVATDRPRPGTVGVAALASTTFYFGYFDFDATGNCEIWCALFVLAAIALARRSRAFGAGACLALAALAKPPAFLFALFVFQPLPARAKSVGLLVAGGASIVLVPLVYFGLHHALGDLFEDTVRANVVHALHETSDENFAIALVRDLELVASWFVAPLFVIAATAIATRRRDRRAFALPALLGLVAVATVVLQRKLYPYHWEILVVPYVVYVAAAHERLARRPLVTVVVASALLVPAIAMVPANVWREPARAALLRLAGKIDEPAFLDVFFVRHHPFPVDEPASARIGAFLEASTTPDETIAVRGYEPQIYFFAHRRAPTRFFWTTFLTSPKRVYRREEWIAEDERALVAAPPRFVVALDPAPDLDSPSWAIAHGYRERERDGRFVVMERMPRPER